MAKKRLKLCSVEDDMEIPTQCPKQTQGSSLSHLPDALTREMDEDVDQVDSTQVKICITGTHPTASAFCPVSSSVTVSSPPPTSVDTRSEKSVDQYLDIQAKDKCDLPKKLRSQHPALSPHGAPVRRSPRLMYDLVQ